MVLGINKVEVSVCTTDGVLDGCAMKLLFRSLEESFAKWGVTVGVPLFSILLLNRWSQSNYVPGSGQQFWRPVLPQGFGESTWLTGCFF